MFCTKRQPNIAKTISLKSPYIYAHCAQTYQFVSKHRNDAAFPSPNPSFLSVAGKET